MIGFNLLERVWSHGEDVEPPKGNAATNGTVAPNGTGTPSILFDFLEKVWSREDAVERPNGSGSKGGHVDAPIQFDLLPDGVWSREEAVERPKGIGSKNGHVDASIQFDLLGNTWSREVILKRPNGNGIMNGHASLAPGLDALPVLRAQPPAAVAPPPPAAPAGPPRVEIGVFSARAFQPALADALARTLNEFDGGLIISATLPYGHLRRLAGDDVQRFDTFRVIDMVSALDRNGHADSGRVSFVSSPTLLEKVLLLASDAVHKAGDGRHCIILDSMSTLRFYNSDVALAQFTHRLTSLARMAGWGALFLMNDHPDNESFVSQLSHLFDDVAAAPRKG